MQARNLSDLNHMWTVTVIQWPVEYANVFLSVETSPWSKIVSDSSSGDSRQVPIRYCY